MKPICVPCKLFYRAKQNGVVFEEGMPTAGTVESPAVVWQPYKLWRGDLWECQGCGHQIISGVARDPLAEHYQHDYANVVELAQPLLRVDDC